MVGKQPTEVTLGDASTLESCGTPFDGSTIERESLLQMIGAATLDRLPEDLVAHAYRAVRLFCRAASYYRNALEEYAGHSNIGPNWEMNARHSEAAAMMFLVKAEQTRRPSESASVGFPGVLSAAEWFVFTTYLPGLTG